MFLVISAGACEDLSVTCKDERAVKRSFSPEEPTAAYYSELQEGRPSAVVEVNQQMKEQYRSLQMRSLTDAPGTDSVSLDEIRVSSIRVNICLLSASKMAALCGSPGQKKLFAINESSVVELEDVFENDMHNRIQASGIAGSGKSTAFMEKAPFEWAKVDLPHGRRLFWQHIALFSRSGQPDPPELVEGTRLSRGCWACSVQSYKRGGRRGGEIQCSSPTHWMRPRWLKTTVASSSASATSKTRFCGKSERESAKISRD